MTPSDEMTARMDHDTILANAERGMRWRKALEKAVAAAQDAARREALEEAAKVVEQYIDDEKLWEEMGSFAQRSDQLEAGLRFVAAAIRARVKP